MAKITAAQVKELREKTGAGMMDCKKALTETDGDMDQAVDFLRTKGIAAAQKKSGRITSEGLVSANVGDDAKLGILTEVNCETDFVAKNEDFIKFVGDLATHIEKNKPESLEALLEQKWIGDESKTTGEFVTSLIGFIGENISVRRFERWEVQGDGLLHSYIHMGGKLGVLVELKTAAADNDAVKDFAKKLSMHIAASAPLAIDPSGIDPAVVEREREIYKTQVIESGKPENIADKIVEGKLGKFYKVNCLLDQEWVHESKTSVKQAMAAAAKEAGSEIEIARFVRWQLGEGLEKRSNDLVGEVAEQLKGK